MNNKGQKQMAEKKWEQHRKAINEIFFAAEGLIKR